MNSSCKHTVSLAGFMMLAISSHGGQSTFVMPMPGKEDQWIAMFDIWNPNDPVNAGYIWLSLFFEKDKPVIRWQDEWTPEAPASRSFFPIASQFYAR